MTIGVAPTQGAPYGASFLGLDATPTGSNATEDVVADFTGATAVLNAGVSQATPILHTPSQTLGSTFKINPGGAGYWLVTSLVVAQTAATVFAGLGFDNVAGELNVDPVFTGTRIRDTGRSVSAGLDTVPIKLVALWEVSRDMADDTTLVSGGLARLLLSNGAGAGAAAASLVLTAAFIMFKWIGPIPPGRS